MAFRRGLEILSDQGRAGNVHPVAIGHVHHQPQAGAGEPVQGNQLPVNRVFIRLVPGADQFAGQFPDSGGGLLGVPDNAIALLPALEG